MSIEIVGNYSKKDTIEFPDSLKKEVDLYLKYLWDDAVIGLPTKEEQATAVNTYFIHTSIAYLGNSQNIEPDELLNIILTNFSIFYSNIIKSIKNKNDAKIDKGEMILGFRNQAVRSFEKIIRIIDANFSDND